MLLVLAYAPTSYLVVKIAIVRIGLSMLIFKYHRHFDITLGLLVLWCLNAVHYIIRILSNCDFQMVGCKLWLMRPASV